MCLQVCLQHFVSYIMFFLSHFGISRNKNKKIYLYQNEKKNNKQTKTQGRWSVWWWWGRGVSVCQCRSVWYSLKSVAKLYITSKHSTLSLSTEHIYMVEKAKNKNQPCDVVTLKNLQATFDLSCFLKLTSIFQTAKMYLPY